MAGRGTMREKKPGVWELRVNVGRDPIARRYRQISETFHGGRRDAEMALNRLAAKHEHRRGANVTFEAHSCEWLDQAVLSPTTKERYEGLLRIWINPVIGHLKVAKLGTYEIDRLLAHMAAQGQSVASIRYAHVVIHRSLELALRWNRVEVNVAEKTDLPKRSENMRPLPEDVPAIHKVLMAAADRDEGLAALIWVAAAAGLRRGEICALQWRQVDLEQGALLIDQAAISVRKRSDTPALLNVRARPARGVLVKDTKTHAVRAEALDPMSVEVLRYHRARVEAQAAAFQTELGPEAYVFSPAVDGRRPWHPDTITHAFSEARLAAGVAHFTLQGLRHWMVTTGLLEGGDSRTVAGRAGHSTAMTLDRYSRFLHRADRQVADAIGAVLGRAPMLPVLDGSMGDRSKIPSV